MRCNNLNFVQSSVFNILLLFTLKDTTRGDVLYTMGYAIHAYPQGVGAQIIISYLFTTTTKLELEISGFLTPNLQCTWFT